jgi:formylglycine-generating enzyme required for sulfatase activity
LEHLADEEEGALENIKERLAFARTIRQKSIDDFWAEWDQAIASVADKEECPQYGGLEIKPQVGMVPIGRDPDSGLWEFSHLQTGDVPGARVNGRLNLTADTGLIFVLIPGGAFDMGAWRPSAKNPPNAPNVDPEAALDESPVHRVTIQPFFLSKYEMTQGQWQRFTKKNPSLYTYRLKIDRYWPTLLHPVENVSWEECAQVLHQLKLRLPSESEWEYAARAGTTTVWWTGNEKKSLEGAANLCDLFWQKSGGSASWHFEDWLDDEYTVHAPVGNYKPNAFGLHDMCGNVWEWCQDSPGLYDFTPTDGSAYELGDLERRILRGGCWYENSQSCRSANRDGVVPGYHYGYVGLRPASSLH